MAQYKLTHQSPTFVAETAKEILTSKTPEAVGVAINKDGTTQKFTAVWKARKKCK